MQELFGNAVPDGSQPRPQGVLLDDFFRHFENRRGEGPGDEVDEIFTVRNWGIKLKLWGEQDY